MVMQKIKEIDVKKLKLAQGVMAVFELLGISEDDLLKIKKIPEMEAELAELRDFKTKALRTLDGKAENIDAKPVSRVISDVYKKPSKEFKPHYGE